MIGRYTTTGSNPQTYYTAYTSPDGNTWTAIPGSTQALSHDRVAAGRASRSPRTTRAPARPSRWTTVSVTPGEFAPPGICPSTWNCADIGTVDPGPGRPEPVGRHLDGPGRRRRHLGRPRTRSTTSGRRWPGTARVSAQVVSQTATDPYAKAGRHDQGHLRPGVALLRGVRDPGQRHRGAVADAAGDNSIQEASAAGTARRSTCRSPGRGPRSPRPRPPDGVNWTPIAGLYGLAAEPDRQRCWQASPSPRTTPASCPRRSSTPSASRPEALRDGSAPPCRALAAAVAVAAFATVLTVAGCGRAPAAAPGRAANECSDLAREPVPGAPAGGPRSAGHGLRPVQHLRHHHRPGPDRRHRAGHGRAMACARPATATSSWTTGGRAPGRPLARSPPIPAASRAAWQRLAAFVHAEGFRFGLYTSPAPRACSGRTGSAGHVAADARTFASWGVDYVKLDWCGSDYSPAGAAAIARTWRAALNATGRPMILSINAGGAPSVGPWAHLIVNSWRVGGDICGSWYNQTQASVRHRPALLQPALRRGDLRLPDLAGPPGPGGAGRSRPLHRPRHARGGNRRRVGQRDRTSPRMRWTRPRPAPTSRSGPCGRRR